jgi:hypothetical protein
MAEHISHALSRMDASHRDEDYDMAGKIPTLPTEEPDNPQANVDPHTEETGTKLQHNLMAQKPPH